MNTTAKILLLTSKLSSAAGGLAVSVPGLAHNVDKIDDMETLVVGTLDRASPGEAKRWGPRVRAFEAHGPGAAHYSPEFYRTLIDERPDLVDVQGLWTYPSWANLRFTELTGTPYIVTPRGMLDPWARRNSSFKKLVAATLFEKRHIQRSTVLRATAEMEAEHFRNFGLSKPIAIVPNAIDIPQMLPRIQRDSKRLLFLSRLHPKKGVEYLLNSWKALQKEFPDWELVVAGIDEGGYEARMKSLAKTLELERVSFPGPVHGDAKTALYRSSDLFVLPTYAENFGLVVAEALANEVPVITTKNAPWKGLETSKSGWWISLEQTELTQTIRKAMLTPVPELQSMGARGRIWVEKEFSHETVANMMAQVYRWVIGKSSRPEHVFV